MEGVLPSNSIFTMFRSENNQPNDVDLLAGLLSEKLELLCKEARENRGEVSSRSLRKLENLQHLLSIKKSSDPRVHQRRIRVAAILSAGLLLFSLLLFTPVKRTEIEGNLTLSDFRFVSTSTLPLTGSLEVSELAAFGLSEMNLPRSRGYSQEAVISSDDTAFVRLTPQHAPAAEGRVTLGSVDLSEGTEVAIDLTKASHGLHISLFGKPTSIAVNVSGTIETAFPQSTPSVRDFSRPKSVALKTGRGHAGMDLTFPQKDCTSLASQLPAKDLTFHTIDESFNGRGIAAKETSAILTGSLSFESIGGKTQALRSYEQLRLKEFNGIIRSIDVCQNGLNLRFAGTVHGMTLGYGQNKRSLMPSWLDWLQAQHGLWLLWGTTAYLVGLLLGILQWLGMKL
jgi:hypothetical protein